METTICNERLTRMKPSASLVLMTRAKEMQKKDPSVIGLAGGEPDFPTPDRICMEAVRRMAQGDTHYAIGAGIPELRERLQKKLLEDNGIQCSANDIIVTPGGKYAIYVAINALLNEGDEVIILNPAWVSYEPIVISAGGVPINVQLDHKTNYTITREVLEAAVTSRTRMLILNYPNNPTGRVLSRPEADAIEAFLLAHPQVLVLSDEIYERLRYDGVENVSMASYESLKSRVLAANGFSKCAAMTGWRLGYLVAPKPYFDPIYRLCQHSISCVSGFVQRAGVTALDCVEEMDAMCSVYKQRRDMFAAKLNEIPGVHCELPQGAFYAWVLFDINGMSAEEVCEYLLENAGVVGMPGTAYGETQVAAMRFSFANATQDMIDAGERIKKALLALQGQQEG